MLVIGVCKFPYSHGAIYRVPPCHWPISPIFSYLRRKWETETLIKFPFHGNFHVASSMERWASLRKPYCGQLAGEYGASGPSADPIARFSCYGMNAGVPQKGAGST